jgi:peptidyl-prolyl cis-trans isomerase C
MFRLWRFVRREPLAQFAVAGALLFALNAMRSNPFGRERIVVSADRVRQLVGDREQLLGRPISSDERRELVTRYGDDEILVREAYARGLEREDGAVRRRLLEVMRFVVGEEPPEPTAAQLRDFLSAHTPAYRTLPAISISQVFFRGNDEGAAGAAAAVLRRLRAGADSGAFGDKFWLGRALDRYPVNDLEQLLGSEFTRALAAMPLNQWTGPVVSTRGLHLVRVDGRFAPELPPFEALASTLRTDWLSAQREALLARKIEPLRKRYRIEIDTAAGHP